MYRSFRGFPPIAATHYRENKCGTHRHTVCQNGSCSSHIDQFNPDCPGELGPHMQHDFYPAHKNTIDAVAVGILVGLVAIAVLG